MKKEYDIKDKVWIHLGEKSLVEGRVVEIIDLEHLGEGHSRDAELYVIELKTGIDDVYEVRDFNQISPDAKGPINLFRKKDMQVTATQANRLLKRVGVQVPTGVDLFDELVKEIDDEIDPDIIHAAMEKAQKDATHAPLNLKGQTSKPKRKFYRKPKTKQ